jgi:hypothetical protein
MLSQLVVVAFQSASPAVRRHLLERLVRPLGLLSLAAVAGGIFAKIRLRGHWQDMQVQFDDVQNVRASDLGALVDHVQQVSVEAVAGVAQVIAASPWMTGSAVAAVLVTVLMRQASLHTSEPRRRLNEAGNKKPAMHAHAGLPTDESALWCPGVGIEPTLLSEPDFESGASTNFTTRATGRSAEIMAQCEA